MQAIRSGSFLGHHMGWPTQNLSESDRGAIVRVQSPMKFKRAKFLRTELTRLRFRHSANRTWEQKVDRQFGAQNGVARLPVPYHPGGTCSTLGRRCPCCCLHCGFAYVLGLIHQRPHLLLEKFRLNLECTMHIFRLNQLVAEIESRFDIPGPLAT